MTKSEDFLLKNILDEGGITVCVAKYYLADYKISDAEYLYQLANRIIIG